MIPDSGLFTQDNTINRSQGCRYELHPLFKWVLETKWSSKVSSFIINSGGVFFLVRDSAILFSNMTHLWYVTQWYIPIHLSCTQLKSAPLVPKIFLLISDWYESSQTVYIWVLPDCTQVISILVQCGRHIIHNDTINRTGKIDWNFDFQSGSETVKHGSCWF